MIDIDEEATLEEILEQFKVVLPKDTFEVNDKGEFCIISDKKSKPLANFICLPVERVQRISVQGNTEISYRFIGIVRNEIVLNKIEVSSKELNSSNWIKKWEMGHYCRIYDKLKLNYQLLMDFFFEVDKEIPTWIEFDTIGWQKYNDEWIYLHSGGTIGKTKVPIRTNNTRFLMKKNKDLSVKEAFLGSLDMLEICDHKLTYSLMSYVLTSLLATPLIQSKQLAPNYVLWIMGGTGYGKTTFSSFFTNIFQATNLARPDAHKTAVLLPGLLEHKDCVFIIDDFGTSKTKNNEYTVINKVEDIIRKLTDRQHITENGVISNGMVLFTGEKFLEQNEQNSSSIRRTIRVKMDNILNPEDISTYDYKKTERFNYHKDKLYFPTSLAHYLEWLSDKLNSGLLEDYKEDFESLRQEISLMNGSHGRYTDSFTHQIIAFNFYMAYGKEQGFITPEQCIQNCNKAKSIFLELLDYQTETIFDRDIEFFLDGLKEVILTKKVVVKEMTQPLLDFDKKIYGVVTVEKNQEVLKLDWENVYEIVSQHIMDSYKHRNSFIGAKKLAKLLDEYNIICFNHNGSTTPYKALNGEQIERCRVINFRTEKIPEIMTVIRQLIDERINQLNGIANEFIREPYDYYEEDNDDDYRDKFYYDEDEFEDDCDDEEEIKNDKNLNILEYPERLVVKIKTH